MLAVGRHGTSAVDLLSFLSFRMRRSMKRGKRGNEKTATRSVDLSPLFALADTKLINEIFICECKGAQSRKYICLVGE